ncbi:ATP-binding cassette domain-containing protein [Subtercola lobariae]|uniref:ATP-binding cassette domain-containing protein n=1 Tax=Subtercola lobariae TaxID=1588641 RepID=UPI001E5E0F90|nr:ATP-binding cassette domain-containing protein [Subtercola lobariae]
MTEPQLTEPLLTEPLLRVTDLAVDYKRRRTVARVVENVSFDIVEGETLGLVGESGSGKSTIGNVVLGLVPAAAGAVIFDGEDITHASPKRRRELTSDIQVVFQDPYGSLNPARSIGATLAESLVASDATLTRKEVTARVHESLDTVGMVASVAQRFPTEFSGGQRQRIAIARALIVRPRLVVCDEAVSALDLSIQAQVLNLLDRLRRERSLSYLFISHDIAVIGHLSDHIAVLDRGRIVETGTTAEVIDHPQDAYTRLLLAAAPVPDPAAQKKRREAFRTQRAEYLASTGAVTGLVSTTRL